MNRPPDWYARRIADEVRYFAELDDTRTAHVAQDAIAKARKDFREHPEARELHHHETAD